MSNNRIVIAGTQSGVGKTTISLGLMAALSQRDYNVQPYKVGPDYIDPGFHSLVTGNTSYNLDSYFLGNDGMKELFTNTSVESDISIIEGVMGLFDGKGKQGESSTAEIAKKLQAPVVLVIDAGKMAQSGAALAYGFKNYDDNLNVKGVILNNIASERHYRLLSDRIEDDPVNLEVLGYIPRQDDLELPERHLGLVPTQESINLDKFINRLVNIMEEYIDLDKVMKLSKRTTLLDIAERKLYKTDKRFDVKVGIAYDQAFNFYYQYNLDLLEKLGAELIYFSPIKDKKLPEVDAVYLGGGFPESFLEELAENKSMKDDIKNKVKMGLPIYAECGGLMYLTRAIDCPNNDKYPMVGLLPAVTKMTDSLQEMGYREIKANRDNIILEKGQRAKGHAFHYSKLKDWNGTINCCYQIKDKLEGYQTVPNMIASYIHLHFASNPKLANNFLYNAKLYRDNEI